MEPIIFTNIFLKDVGPETILIFYNKNVKSHVAIYSGFDIYYVNVSDASSILDLKEVTLNDNDIYEDTIIGVRTVKSDAKELNCILELMSGSYVKITTDMTKEHYFPKLEVITKENDLLYKTINTEYSSASDFDLIDVVDFRF